MTAVLDRLDVPALQERLDTDGVASTPPLLTPEQCADVTAMFDEDERFRSTVVMARHAFGEGSYRYFADPLPPLVQQLREELYPPLAQIANRVGGAARRADVPDRRSTRCSPSAPRLGQHRPTPLVLRYGPGGYNCLHQDVYGDLTFPLQFLVMLSRPDEDFTGGESVFVEQRPRQQSRPIVLRPAAGRGRGLPGAPPAAARGPRVPPRADAARGERRAQRQPARAGDHLPQRAVKTRYSGSWFSWRHT